MDEYDIRFHKNRLVRISEAILSILLISLGAIPTLYFTGSDLLAAFAGCTLATAFNEILWRYRDIPELAPSSRLRDTLTDR